MTARRITFLTEVHARPDIAQRCVDEFEAYFSKRGSVTFGYYELPEMTCYCPIREIKRQIEYNYREIKKIMENGGRILFDEMKRRGLVPAGPLFGINVVGVFFGSEIAPEDYVFRFAIPIE